MDEMRIGASIRAGKSQVYLRKNSSPARVVQREMG